MVQEYSDDKEILHWLNEGLGCSTAYLRLLRPGHDEWSMLVLANLKNLADRLRDEPAEWERLIRMRNWRFTLIGCSAILLTRDERFLDPLIDRFREGSWVDPQLALTLGLIHPDKAVDVMEEILDQATISTHTKKAFSAYAVLKRLGRRSFQEFESSELFRRTQGESIEFWWARSESLTAMNVIQSQWNFWISQNHE